MIRNSERKKVVHCNLMSVFLAAAYNPKAAVVFHAPKSCSHIAYNAFWEMRRKIENPKKLNAEHDCSNLFVTGLADKEAIFGGEKILKECLLDVVAEQKPEYIIVTAGCAAGVIGDDVAAICQEVEQTTEVPVLYVEGSGFMNQKAVDGVLSVTKAICQRFVDPLLKNTKDPASIAVVGMHSIFSPSKESQEINRLLEEENKFILLCGQKSQLMRERALQVGAEIEEAIKPQQPVDKLTILFLAANPQDTQKLALDQEVRSITEAIRKSEGRDGIEFFSRWAVQSLDILQAINETDPEIIHFSGHGSEKGEIVLDDGSGNMSMVSKEAMAAAVASASKKVRMIFFNACFSQKEAQAVVDKVEAAIGMNTEIGDEAAIVFAAQFYSSIGFGQNLQQAFDQAKAALLLKGIAEENTPVLYVRKGLLAQDIVMVESEALKKSDNVTIMQKIKKIFS